MTTSEDNNSKHSIVYTNYTANKKQNWKNKESLYMMQDSMDSSGRKTTTYKE